MKMVLITALGVGGATVFGALLGFLFKKISQRFSDIVLSFAAGVMLSAAVLGLIIPSLEYGGRYGLAITVIGIFAGALCLNVIDRVVPHLHRLAGADVEKHNNANLNKVLEQLDAVSDEPDAALVAIKGQVKTMITEATTIKAKLGTIKSNASQMESDPIPEPYKRKGVLVDGLDDTIS